MRFCMVYQEEISNVHLLYSFIHVFIHNIFHHKVLLAKFCQPLAKAFRKTSIILFLFYFQRHPSVKLLSQT